MMRKRERKEHCLVALAMAIHTVGHLNQSSLSLSESEHHPHTHTPPPPPSPKKKCDRHFNRGNAQDTKETKQMGIRKH